jgi:hypothetical protein
MSRSPTHPARRSLEPHLARGCQEQPRREGIALVGDEEVPRPPARVTETPTAASLSGKARRYDVPSQQSTVLPGRWRKAQTLRSRRNGDSGVDPEGAAMQIAQLSALKGTALVLPACLSGSQVVADALDDPRMEPPPHCHGRFPAFGSPRCRTSARTTASLCSVSRAE